MSLSRGEGEEREVLRSDMGEVEEVFFSILAVQVTNKDGPTRTTEKICCPLTVTQNLAHQ